MKKINDNELKKPLLFLMQEDVVGIEIEKNAHCSETSTFVGATQETKQNDYETD